MLPRNWCTAAERGETQRVVPPPPPPAAQTQHRRTVPGERCPLTEKQSRGSAAERREASELPVNVPQG